MANQAPASGKKNSFASSFGFVMAAAGSAVGLGNLWGFPYKTGAYGGAAFVLVYILCVLFMGIVAMTCEIILGRGAQANPITALKKVKPAFGFIGLAAIVIPFFITCYYSVLGGYTLFSTGASLTNTGKDFSAIADGMTNFMGNPLASVICTVIFLLMAALVIFGGVQKGIEKASKVLMPALFVILVGVMIYSLCLGEGVMEGLKFYILQLDFQALGFEGVTKAMGQAFFSLSLGMGIMISYGSYTGKEINVGKSVMQICIFDSVIALFAGLAIFPAAYHFMAVYDVPAESLGLGGFKLMYYTLPQVFASMGTVGSIVGFLFFVMVVIAALTSVMSLLEVVTQFIIQRWKVSRKIAVVIPFVLISVLSIPVSLSLGGAFTVSGMDLLTFMDEMTNTVLMPVVAFAGTVIAGWFLSRQEKHTLIGTKGKWYPDFVHGMSRFVTPVLILFVEISGVVTSIQGNAQYWPVVVAGYALALLCAIIYFLALRNADTGCNADELALKK